ncbi:hypothetical protein COU96_00570, partial [Candidatus Shapirobacteria bacterium CG10_big_fil_rev_8_21_14_0_10_38_14]
GATLFWGLNQNGKRISGFLSPLGPALPKPLEKYSFEALRERGYLGSEIKLEKVIKQEEEYTSWLFSYLADGKKITGMANVPLRLRSGQAKFPVVLMMRGYADDEAYFTGLGTRKAAGVFAENGFITLAPDFLGFGGSDSSSKDILEARFNRPVEVLHLLASIKGLPQANSDKIAIWAHSNGGQIALSVLEISQKPIPTTLWAPVTRGFPESILAYMGEMDDQGKKVKREVDKFVRTYDAKEYSIDNYFADINAHLQLHQGLFDPLVAEEWSADFVSQMNSLGKKISYFTYPRSDHNLKQDWNLVVEQDIKFFQKELD